jgi:hypothetical protein
MGGGPTMSRYASDQILSGLTGRPNQIVDRTTASIGIPDIMTITTRTTSTTIPLRRWSLTIGRSVL